MIFKNIYDLFSQEYAHKLTNFKKCKKIAEEIHKFSSSKNVLEVDCI